MQIIWSALLSLVGLILFVTGLTSLIDLMAAGQPIADVLSASADVLGLSVAGVIIGALSIVVILVAMLRGRHPWTTAKLELSITYLNKEGSKAVSQRKQVFSPNHRGVKGVITSVTTTGFIREDDWTLKEPAGKQVRPRRSLLDAATYKAICFVCPDNQSLPFPWWGIFAPRSFIARNYSIELNGEIHYVDAWTEEVENFVCDPTGPIKTLEITIQVPSSRIKSRKNRLIALLYREDNSIVSRSKFPFVRSATKGDDGLSLHECVVTYENLRADESVFLEWELK